MHIDEHKLARKGWRPHEIRHAKRIIQKAERKKHAVLKGIEKTFPYAQLLIAAAAHVNAIILVLIVHFLLPPPPSLFFTAILGFMAGLFITGTILHFKDNNAKTTITITAITLASSAMLALLLHKLRTFMLFSQPPLIIVAALFFTATLVPTLYAAHLHEDEP
ncbi:hypothetical protein D6783_04770 [Candidatus Woesearchaeota archaeon]|nr:MAG: hypothetical protein D6783_04770 [Candidatus Woesearchaeota archaeon]